MNTDRVIVARHRGLLEWLARRNITGKVIKHATPEDVTGKHVVGTLPLHLAALAASVTVVDFPRLPEAWRGQELDADQMDQAGAKLKTYTVREA